MNILDLSELPMDKELDFKEMREINGGHSQHAVMNDGYLYYGYYDVMTIDAITIDDGSHLGKFD